MNLVQSLFCFRKNLSIHGGLFRSCGPPLDPESGKVEDCPTFEEVLGGIIQRPLIIGRTLLISTIVIHFVVLLLSLGMIKYKKALNTSLLKLCFDIEDFQTFRTC